MLPEVVDGIIGADTHRDTHQLEIAFFERRDDRHPLI
jgi:hypothetical protein